MVNKVEYSLPLSHAVTYRQWESYF